jgi:hypothetical protein
LWLLLLWKGAEICGCAGLCKCDCGIKFALSGFSSSLFLFGCLLLGKFWACGKFVFMSMKKLDLEAIRKAKFSICPSDAIKAIKKEIMKGDEDKINYDVSIYNSIGQKVYFNKNEKQIDLTKVNDGIYFIEIKSTEKIYYGKIIKHE